MNNFDHLIEQISDQLTENTLTIAVDELKMNIIVE